MKSIREIKLRLAFFPLLFKFPPKILRKFNSYLKFEKMTRINGQTIVNSYLPAYPSLAFNRYLNLIVNLRKGEMSPQVGIISVTDDCPYKCYHCSNEIAREKKNPSLKMLAKTIQELIASGVYKIGISGGEPFLRKDLDELVKLASPYSQVMINTTGYNVNLEKLKKLKRAGLTGLRISLDYYEENKFDQMRGYEGAFQNALNCIQMSLRADLYTSIAFVPTKKTILPKELEKFINFAEKTGAHEVTIFEPKPTGRLLNFPPEFFLNDKEREVLVELQKKVNSDRKRKIKVLSFPYLESNQMIGCTAGSLYFYIDARGSVFPCLFYPFELGNINRESLAEIIKKSQKIFSCPKCYCLAFSGKDIIKNKGGVKELKDLANKYARLPNFYADFFKSKKP